MECFAVDERGVMAAVGLTTTACLAGTAGGERE